MKNRTIIAASLAMLTLLAGCSKLNSDIQIPQTDEGLCELSVNCSGVPELSKAIGQTVQKESTIQNVQIFVFRAAASGSDAGVLDACLSAGFQTPLSFDASSTPYIGLTLTCTAGVREVWAVVNSAADYTADASVGNKAALLAKTTSLGESSSSKLFMIGSSNVTLNPGQASVDIVVKRVCASVVLRSIKNAMESSAYRGAGSFKVDNIYLTNVPAKLNFALTLAPASLAQSDWYGRLGRETDAAKTALVSDTQSPVVIEYGKTNTTVHTFYAFPNNCAPQTSSSWSARATRLVVEAQYYDGSAWHRCYYPVTLYNSSSCKGLERNKQYTVDLTVKRPGSDSPEKPIEFDTASGSISVAVWDSGGAYTETI